jgi:hypothetical protein
MICCIVLLELIQRQQARVAVRFRLALRPFVVCPRGPSFSVRRFAVLLSASLSLRLSVMLVSEANTDAEGRTWTPARQQSLERGASCSRPSINSPRLRRTAGDCVQLA